MQTSFLKHQSDDPDHTSVQYKGDNLTRKSLNCIKDTNLQNNSLSVLLLMTD